MNNIFSYGIFSPYNEEAALVRRSQFRASVALLTLLPSAEQAPVSPNKGRTNPINLP